MKIKEGFSLRDVCGENVLLATGRETIDFTKIITLNESAALLWRALEGKEFEVENMVQVLTDEYDVEGDVARQDALAIVEQWKEIGIL